MGSMSPANAIAKRRFMAIEWLNSLFLGLNIPVDSSEEELRLQLFDGTILCGIMNKQDPVAIVNQRGAYMSSEQRREKVERFLSAVEEMGVPRFSASDLEHGPISAVVDCLLSLRDHLSSIDGGSDINGTAQFGNHPNKSGILVEGESDAIQSSRAQNGKSFPLLEKDKKRQFTGSRFQLVLQSAITSDQSAASLLHAGHKFHEVFQLKQGRFSDIPAAKLSEIMRSNGLDNAPTQSLLSVVNCILDESIERKNGEIPLRVGFLLRKVFQEVERRVSTQAEHVRKQNNLIKAREEKYQSRIKVLQTLAAGTNEETQIALNQLELIKEQKATAEENKKHEEHLAFKLAKDNENNDRKISELTHELETMKSSYEHQCQQVEAEAKHNEGRFQERIKEIELMLLEANKRINELESLSEAKFQNWNMKESFLHNFISFQLQSLKGLKISHESIKVEFAASQRKWRDEINGMGIKLKVLVDAAENYHTVLAENRKLYNEVQELKGNIRVYCRIRPFLPGQNAKSTTVDYIGENGEIVLVNPSKQGKDGSRMFKFNKVFVQAATQVQVFLDIQPLIRSVLDGFNVCIFAYGQTGSGKTYTMSGPNSSLEEEWGVNYRALNDLFHISQVRRNAFTYEVGVQMIEIYNEQIRDLLSNNSSHKRLGVLSSSQPHGLAVPDANMVPVKSTADVLELMQVGFANRAVGSTALNERSSRSHSILTVHVRGVDLKNGSTSRGSLHLIDLAGSERVDRSEVVGDRLKEAQYINKSLSALGDVIFALSQKNAHVPYRNSKLTHVLQSSLGGQAKTLMFVHVNPDVESYLETLSTLKFAERVSGVELGAARSNKEGKDIKGLIEQVASLKDTIARKDEEIEQLQMLKDPRTQSPKGNLVKHDFSSADVSSLGGMIQQGGGNVLKFNEKDVTDPENLSDYSDKELEAGSLSAGDSFHADEEHMGSCDADFEGRLSDVSGGDISIGEDSEYSMANNNDSETITEKISKAPLRIAKPLSQQTGYLSTRSKSSDSLKSSVAKKSTLTSGAASCLKQVKR